MHNNPVSGIVKWIGKNQGVDTSGIEVVSLKGQHRNKQCITL